MAFRGFDSVPKEEADGLGVGFEVRAEKASRNALRVCRDEVSMLGLIPRSVYLLNASAKIPRWFQLFRKPNA